MKLKTKKILMALAGTTGAAICVGLLQKSEMGADPYTCFVTGWSNLFGTSFMVMFLICTALLLIVSLLVGRKYLGIATIFNLLLGGTISSLTRYVLDSMIPDATMVQRAEILAVALIFVSFMSALYTTAEEGVSTYDAVSLIMSEKYHLSVYYKCRIFTDVICILVALMLHTTVGIGTILTGFCMGPLIQWFRKHVAEIILYGKKNEKKRLSE